MNADYPPYLIFLRVLFELYGDEVAEEQAESGNIPVTTFQQHGVWRALRILKEFGGVLIADSVGLGKTYVAGEIIRLYRERRQRVLLVCPAALRDGPWATFLHKYELFVDCLSYEELASERQLGGDYDRLRAQLDDYALVVVDEAHNFRNPSTPSRAGILRRLLSGPRRDLVLLSATPVNNSLWDLYHLLHYFLRQDAGLAQKGVLSLRERFEEAMRQDPFNINPDLLYPILDATTVKRTRQFVKKHYENDQIKLANGGTAFIRFPRPVPSSITYNLDSVLPGFLSQLETALMPADGEPLLTMARYQASSYRQGTPTGDETALVGLLRSALLKRFESSVYAFATTTEKMFREHKLFLDGLKNGRVLRKELMRELAASDDDDVVEEMLDNDSNSEPASDFDHAQLQADVENDCDLLERLHQTSSAVKADNDPKLAALVEELGHIAKHAYDEGIDEEDRRRRRKVLIFSFYADTVEWIRSFLETKLRTDARLKVYRGRMVAVSGTDTSAGISRDRAVEGFAPESAGDSVTKKEDQFDLLISTDVLAEGLNLQQCRNIINYDLPWNPMRLVQRHGRVDRIGSPHDKVFLRTFFPDKELDRLLVLEHRVRRKLAQAAASVGLESAPIIHGPEREVAFSETREEIENLRKGNPSLYERGGTPAAAQSGEEYRQELRESSPETWR